MKLKKNILKISTGVVVAGLLVIGGMSMTCSDKKVVVLNAEKMNSEAVLFQKIAQEQQKYETFLKTQVMVLQEVLQADADSFKKKEKTMTASEIRKARVELEEKAAVLQKRYQDEAAKIATVSKVVMNQVNLLLADTIAEFAKDGKYDLILPQNAVVYFSDKRDVTSEFVRLFNEKTKGMAYADLIRVPEQAVPAEQKTAEPTQIQQKSEQLDSKNAPVTEKAPKKAGKKAAEKTGK